MTVEQDRRGAAAAGPWEDVELERLRHIVQFALPINATLAVAAAGLEDAPPLGKPDTHPFPRPHITIHSDAALINDLESLRDFAGIRFLVVPASKVSWLASHIDLAAYIERSCRLVLDEPGAGRVYALREVEEIDEGARRALRGLDGLPFPPIEMMRLTAGLFDLQGEALYRAFFRQGKLGAKWITEVLAGQGREMDDFRSVLDFGGGCGRVMRHWKSVEGPTFHGSDLNEYLIGWASENLPFARFSVNGYAPPLPYADGAHDLVYSISVFTHLLEPLQREWAAEMGRVIASGGILLMTAHGRQNVAELDSGARPIFDEAGGLSKLDAGELVVMRPEYAGTNSVAVFHPERYVREVIAPAAGMSVLGHIPLGAKDAHQDVYILQKGRRSARSRARARARAAARAQARRRARRERSRAQRRTAREESMSDKWTTADMPDQSGRTAIVTGGNSGLGLETVRELAAAGARVVLACRNTEKGEAALGEIRAGDRDADVEVAQLDLASFDSVRAFAERIRAEHSAIDLLVNNAGVMAPPRQVTADGYELQFGTNHLGHFALTAQLIDAMGGDDPRIVTVSSGAHRMGKIDFDDLQRTRRYNRWRAYGQSKLANLLFAYELDRRLRAADSPVKSVAAHPGYAATNLQFAAPPMLDRLVMTVSNRVVAQSAAMGALPQLYAATYPGLEGGTYVGPDGIGEQRGHPKPVGSSGAARDKESARRLWQVSEGLTGVVFEIPEGVSRSAARTSSARPRATG